MVNDVVGAAVVDHDHFVGLAEELLREDADRGRAAADAHALLDLAVDQNGGAFKQGAGFFEVMGHVNDRCLEPLVQQYHLHPEFPEWCQSMRRSMAGNPAAVAGTLIMRFGRPMCSCRRMA